jgi:hypothetical protein
MDIKPCLDFWYRFDLLFNPTFGQVSEDVLEAYDSILNLPALWLSDRSSNDGRDYPSNFSRRILDNEEIADSLNLLANYQFNEYNKLIEMSGDKTNLQRAFEFFGQGILFDNCLDEITQQPRRPNNEKVHMMDIANVGYPRWYVFCRSAVIAGLDSDFWTIIARLVAVAFSLHSSLNPVQSVNGEDPQNKSSPLLAKKYLAQFRKSDLISLDKLFDNQDIRNQFGVPLIIT